MAMFQAMRTQGQDPDHSAGSSESCPGLWLANECWWGGCKGRERVRGPEGAAWASPRPDKVHPTPPEWWSPTPPQGGSRRWTGHSRKHQDFSQFLGVPPTGCQSNPRWLNVGSDTLQSSDSRNHQITFVFFFLTEPALTDTSPPFNKIHRLNVFSHLEFIREVGLFTSSSLGEARSAEQTQEPALLNNSYR